ncbi:MAG TPA: hypothetical protein VG937_12035 [Polyangiaceae bacterium]|nr:hypothetical protein [Polyangiaceae bacterium]
MLSCCFAQTACGDARGAAPLSDGDPDTASLGTCALRAQVTGGTTIQFTGSNDAACATLHSSETGLDAVFIGADAKGTLELVVEQVTEGGTGVDYPTRVLVTSTAKDHWQGSDCLTSITEHRLLKSEASELGELRHYQVSGHGSCSAPLDAMPTGPEAVTLGSFAFRAEFTWRD